MEFFAIVLTAAFCAALLFALETPASIAKSELTPLLPIYKDVHRDPELFDLRTADLRAGREATRSRDGLVVLMRTNMGWAVGAGGKRPPVWAASTPAEVCGANPASAGLLIE